ncbi:MAG: EAL domain-containing protein [Bacillota bacterium]|nr:EAL domain-containing protein [Bacillota bacterium]
MNVTYDFNIRELIDKENIIVHFQPIVSIKKNKIIGFEALSRGIVGESIIPPDILFEIAEENDLVLELDRLCRRKIIEVFTSIDNNTNNTKLFINLDTSIIDKNVVGSGNFYNLICDYSIKPENVVIEIKESKVNDTKSLMKFINTYRDYGFIIALDDIGSGHSNMDRFALVKPDIIKIDKALIKNINVEFYKQEVFKSLSELARKVGAFVVAEGVESEEEAVSVLQYGVDIIQGYYYSKPMVFNSINLNDLVLKTKRTGDKFKVYSINKTKHEMVQKYKLEVLGRGIAKELKSTEPCEYDHKLGQVVKELDFIECAYILDEKGIQKTNTIYDTSDKCFLSKRCIFEPAVKGTDHSYKDYYFMIHGTTLQQYISEPYISMATGNLCKTVSEAFSDSSGNKHILCLDININ